MERKGTKDPLHALPPEVTHLKARPTDDLDWEWDSEKRQIFCFDFGLAESFDPFDEALFAAHALALKEFEEKIPLENVAGALLYHGPLAKTLEMTQLFSDYLHRLGSVLSVEIPISCHFILTGDEEPALLAQQLSMRRFEHFKLIIEGHPLGDALRESETPLGLVLPQDELLEKPEVRASWNSLAEGIEEPFRILPEELINELWFGIDTLIVFESGLTDIGVRMIKGFEATGGEVKRKSE